MQESRQPTTRGSSTDDLKPDNILIDPRGVCNVIDFGIARLHETDSRTRTGSVMGTLAYMAPEQRANAKGIEVTADVFALTVTLYSMLSGEVPTELFMAEHHPELMDPIPEVLRPILLEGLRYDPKQRTPSVQALQDALESIRGDLPTPEVPVPPLTTGNTASQTVPAQTRPPATDPGPAPTESHHRNVPDTLEEQNVLEEEELLALIPDLMKELDEDFEQEDSAAKAARKKAAARARLEALSSQGKVDLSRKGARPSRDTSSSTSPPEDTGDVTELENESGKPNHVTKNIKSTSNNGAYAALLGAVDIATNLVLKPMLPLILLIVVALVPFLLFTGMTASNVNAAAAAHQQARVNLLGIIEAESSVLDSIDALGGDSSQSRFYRVRFNGMTEADRPQAAMAYVANLNKDLTRVIRSTPSEQQIRAKEAKQQLDRLKIAVSNYELTRDSWSAIAQSMSGRTACRTGMATCPP